MPSQSTLSKEEKHKVKSAIPAPSNKIFYATLARVYYAYPQPNEWSYSGLQGALALTKNNSTGTLSFRLVDMSGTRGVIWEHEFYDGLDYFADRAFFHSFPGDNSMIGFAFSNESDAKDFWKKVLKMKDEKRTPTSGSFVHVAHMGCDSESGFTSNGVHPSWTDFLGQLENSGIDKEMIAKETDYIRDFVRSHPQRQPAAAKGPKKPRSPPPPSRKAHGQNDSISASPPPPPLRRPQRPPAAAPSHTPQPPASLPPPVRPPVRATPGSPPPVQSMSSAPVASPPGKNGRQKNQEFMNRLEQLSGSGLFCTISGDSREPVEQSATKF
ncbi:hypothetical protein IW261DRAFT_1493478 [Armillaria novae-zelandiae]|uniref:WH1 domain-containing protein n=1 Tax=Armillaria novae-zelandiae TaxID=153914 RepID=A0AA39TAE1_9AGAR|nr:hypothetical protein IW261DRAFT_1493478 [Armillaria novae-zelandiae]